MTETQDDRVEDESASASAATQSTEGENGPAAGEEASGSHSADEPQPVEDAAPPDDATDSPAPSRKATEAPSDPESGGAETGKPKDDASTVADDESPAPAADEVSATADAKAKSESAPKRAATAPVAPPRPEKPEVTALREAQQSSSAVEGQVIGWNNGGLHVVVNGVTAFCPRSEIEIGSPKALESYLDQKMSFHVLRVQKRGRRVVLSRKAILKSALTEQIEGLRAAMREGKILEGKVSSITDFGLFVDLGGLDGLVHISEISRSRVEHASEVASEGDTVQVRILKISDDGERISLSMKALEPDPWDGLEDRFSAGSVVQGTVEKVAKFGAFIEIAPGVTGLLPTSAMNLPRDAQPARVYNPGKEVSVQILSIDRRRRRISLSLEGSQVEATRADLKTYLNRQSDSGGSFGALAAAFDKAKQGKDG